jgi:hypothetical protein
MNNVRHENIRILRNRTGISETQNNRNNSINKYMIDLYRGINEYKNSYQLRTNLIKYKNGDLILDNRNILKSLNISFRQLLNTHSINDVRQI